MSDPAVLVAAVERSKPAGFGPKPRLGLAVMAISAAVVLGLGVSLWLATGTGVNVAVPTAASVGATGIPEDDELPEWTVVQIRHESATYTIAFGTSGPRVTTVRVTLGDDSTIAVEPSAGTWRAVLPSRGVISVEQGPAVTLEALDGEGAVLTSEEVEDKQIADRLTRPPPGSERSR